MKQTSRTKNVARNVAVSLMCQAFNVLIRFVGRTVFIYILGKEYLGVNGLFANIFTMLSFAELGIGGAMTYSMYKPLAEGDTEKLKSIMKLYRKAYFCVGATVIIAGLCISPFLRMIVGETPDIPENLYVVYVLFLLDAASSYFFVYKKAIITADQRIYIVNTFHEITGAITVAVQSVILLTTHNYILFMIIQICGTLLDNIWTSHIANKMYPFLKEKAAPMDAEEKKGIFANIRSMALYRFGTAILNGTDNIIISSMFSVSYVGLISNYTMISNVFSLTMSKITTSFLASIGNLNAKESPEKQYEVFVKLVFILTWMFGFISFGMLLFFNNVIELWIGRDYLVDEVTVLALVLSFYVVSVQFATDSYRTTLGLFRRGRYAPVVAAFVNIILSVLLAKVFGLSGVFFATAIVRFFIIGAVDVHLIYKYGFKRRSVEYYLMYLGYFLLITAIYLLTGFVFRYLRIDSILGLVVKILIATVIYNGVFLLIFGRTRMFKEIWASFRSLFKRKRRKASQEQTEK